MSAGVGQSSGRRRPVKGATTAAAGPPRAVPGGSAAIAERGPRRWLRARRPRPREGPAVLASSAGA
eukprot:6793236-Lingulodinium_polyedra.AAC.1